MPATIDHRARKRRIASKCVKLFSDVGYKEVTFQMIAVHCDIARTVLYRYFTDKRQVFDEAIREVIGRIAPGERIAVIARVGDWCLTAKGWTLFKWLTKERDVFDSKALRDVYGAALSQAAKDYCRCIRHLRRLKKGDEDRFHDLMYQLDILVGWFLSDDYLAVFDTVPGNERLDKMNEQLGVDKDWLRELCRIYEEMDRKKPHRRVVYRK